MRHIRKHHRRFRHFYDLNTDLLCSNSAEEKQELDKQIARCQLWHRDLFQYDVAVSFAGEQRQFARRVSNALKKHDLRVFFDEDESQLTGANLRKRLYRTYFNESRFCVMVISTAYRDKVWTNHEREAALDRMLAERGTDYYLIPVRVDGTRLQGLSNSIGYLPDDKGAPAIARIVSEKTWADPTAHKKKFGTWLFDAR